MSASQPPPGTVTERKAIDEGRIDQSLSQLVAKILDQLSISAWLPSAVLVLSIAFVVQLDVNNGNPAEALEGLGALSISGALLLLGGVIAMTVVTQAFEFEAIRVLEGYWSPFRPIELVADLFVWRQTGVRDRLVRRRQVLLVRAYEQASTALRLDADKRAQRNYPPVATERDIELIGAWVLETEVRPPPHAEEIESARAVDWMDFAPGPIVRRINDLSRKLKDYPEGNRVLPTRLGNVLRSYEDKVFSDATLPLEGLVQRVFHLLPKSTQDEHDQYRSRLNLYCSLVVVVLVVTAISTVVLWDLGWDSGVAALLVGLVSALLGYRAAISSAQAYGGVLIVIGAQMSEDKSTISVTTAPVT